MKQNKKMAERLFDFEQTSGDLALAVVSASSEDTSGFCMANPLFKRSFPEVTCPADLFQHIYSQKKIKPSSLFPIPTGNCFS